MLEVVNFFKNPTQVRSHALKQTFKPYTFSRNGIWSGFRTKINNSAIEEELFCGIEHITKKVIKNINPCFHLNPRVSMHGFPHHDSEDPNSFAGVIYLNQEYPENCGTTIYEELPSHKSLCDQYILNYTDKMEIVYSTNLNPNNKFKHQFSQECLNFKKHVLKKIKSFDFEFNKLICYSGNILHSPDFYFGDSLDDSRLTVAFHGTFHAI